MEIRYPAARIRGPSQSPGRNGFPHGDVDEVVSAQDPHGCHSPLEGATDVVGRLEGSGRDRLVEDHGVGLGVGLDVRVRVHETWEHRVLQQVDHAHRRVELVEPLTLDRQRVDDPVPADPDGRRVLEGGPLAREQAPREHNGVDLGRHRQTLLGCLAGPGPSRRSNSQRGVTADTSLYL